MFRARAGSQDEIMRTAEGSRSVDAPKGADLQYPKTTLVRLLSGAAVLAVLFFVGYLVFIATAWGHEFDNEGYFGREGEGRALATAGNHLLSRVTAGVVAIGLIVLVATAALRRTLLVGIIAAAGISVAIAGAQVWKATLPWSALVDSDSELPVGLFRDTYPSGHTTIGMSFALAVLILVSPQVRWWVAPLTGIGASLFAVGVVIAGWHRPSDAIGGAFWSGLVMSLAACLAVKLQGCEREDAVAPDTLARQRRSSIWSCVGIALLIYLMLLAIATFVSNGLPDADIQYAVMIALILAAVFSVQLWFANVLVRTSWRSLNVRSAAH